jgi:hypothetical protein
MSDETKLADSAYGALYYRNGEVLTIAHTNDPTAYRGGIPDGATGGDTRSLVRLAGDIIRSDRVHEEVGNIQIKLDERYPKEALAGEMTVLLRAPWYQDAEPGMRHVATLRHDYIEFHVPVRGIGGGGTLPQAIVLRSRANGKLLCVDLAQLDAHGEPKVTANRDGAGPWETFDIIAVE